MILRPISIIFFSVATVLILSLTPTAYAGTLQPDNYPGLPDALVNYDSVNKESTITWDFSGLPNYPNGDPAKCAIKADFGFSSDPEDDPSVKVNGFMARYYSPEYDPSGHNAVPTYDPSAHNTNTAALQSTDNSDTDIQGEEIPCTGELIINFGDLMGTTYFHDDPDWAPLDWNIVGHDNNTAIHNGVEPFVSFYIMNSNGDFVTDDSKVVDEVLILYHPESVISDATIEWACGFYDTNPENQVAVGNVLFIDQNGFTGTAGPDNCDTVVELEESEFCCIFYSGGSGSSNDGCIDCIDPTFYDSQNKNIVKAGFVYNNYSTDVNATHTETPPLITNVNQTNVMKLKVYDNSGTDAIEWVDVGFGLSSMYHSFDDSEATIEIRFLNNDKPKLTIKDTLNLMDFGNVTSSIVSCGYVGTNCLEVTIPHIFRDNFEHKMVVIRAQDQSTNIVYNYMNDGIEIHGESINEAPTDRVFIQKYIGNTEWEWLDITRTDRINDIWASEDGIQFQRDNGGGFQRMNPIDFEDVLTD